MTFLHLLLFASIVSTIVFGAIYFISRKMAKSPEYNPQRTLAAMSIALVLLSLLSLMIGGT